MHMEGMQLEMENHVLLKKELEERMRLAIRESNTMESMLNELDDEYEKAISKIELLEGEVIDLLSFLQPFFANILSLEYFEAQPAWKLLNYIAVDLFDKVIMR